MGATLKELRAWAKNQDPPGDFKVSAISYHRRHIKVVMPVEGGANPPPSPSDEGLITAVRDLAFQILRLYSGNVTGIRSTDVKLLQVAVQAVLGREKLAGVSAFDEDLNQLIEQANKASGSSPDTDKDLKV